MDTPAPPADDRLTAVVLTYDRRDLLDVILPAIERQTMPGLRVLVVDNGSSDGSAGYVRERWPDYAVLELPTNIGVAAALNRGVAAVGSEYVALLNNDLELEPDYLQLLVQALDRHPEASSAIGKMLSFFDRTRFDGAGDVFMWSGIATHRGVGEVDAGQYDTPEAVFSPCAGAAVYRRCCFDVVGLFDEDFFAYLEDADWGLRAQLAGFSARYEPAAVSYHMGSATTSGEPARYNALLRRNQLWVIVKDYPASALARHASKLVVHQVAWVVTAAREGRLREQLGVLVAAARGIPGMLRKRRAVQATRQVSLAQLDAVMSPEPSAGQSPAQRARSIGAEVTSPWFYLQLGLILVGAGLAYASSAALRSRVQTTSLGMGWPAPLRLFMRVLVGSAFTAPHVTEFITLDMTPTMELRTKLQGLPEFAGVKVTPLLLVAKALLLAVKRNPEINSTWDEAAQEIVVKSYVNLGIAAATPRGLLVPNIKDAEQLTLPELAAALNQLTGTAREGKTSPADMARGTITITNVGTFGVDNGTPILNPGESAILCFGAVRPTPWVVDGQVVVRQVTQLALSFDHRNVDGQLGSQFLADIARVLSDPATALAWT